MQYQLDTLHSRKMEGVEQILTTLLIGIMVWVYYISGLYAEAVLEEIEQFYIGPGK